MSFPRFTKKYQINILECLEECSQVFIQVQTIAGKNAMVTSVWRSGI
jgi:hypothetical protein